MTSPRIVYVSHSESTREAQASALANVYRLVLDRAMKNAALMTSTNGTSVRDMEGVGDVGQRSD